MIIKIIVFSATIVPIMGDKHKQTDRRILTMGDFAPIKINLGQNATAVLYANDLLWDGEQCLALEALVVLILTCLEELVTVTIILQVLMGYKFLLELYVK